MAVEMRSLGKGKGERADTNFLPKTNPATSNGSGVFIANQFRNAIFYFISIYNITR